MSNIDTYKKYDEADQAAVEHLYQEVENRPGEYHVKLADGDDIDLYFIRPKDISIKWKKFNKKGEPPTVLDHKPEPDEADDPTEFKEMWTFPIYDPEADKEGFIEFSGPSTIKSIVTYLHGNEKITPTNFLHIVRVGDGKATRYGVKPAK